MACSMHRTSAVSVQPPSGFQEREGEGNGGMGDKVVSRRWRREQESLYQSWGAVEKAGTMWQDQARCPTPRASPQQTHRHVPSHLSSGGMRI